MKIKTQNLTGLELDWAVAKCEYGLTNAESFLDGVIAHPNYSRYLPSLNWAQGGPIIEREGIETAPRYADDGKTITGWTAMMFNDARNPRPLIVQHGDTLLVAAMRCTVLAVLGEEVEVPEKIFSQP